jgi:chorismate synthase
MAGNSFGTLFKIHTFGESHGEAIGVVIDGCPAGLNIDMDFLQSELDRRKPGQSHITSPRKESDEAKIISGVFNGQTMGTPICIMIANENPKEKDYAYLKDTFRPSHADFTYEKKYGTRDYRGGGRSSARETAARVAAGAIAKMLLKKEQIHITAFVTRVGPIQLTKDIHTLDLSIAQNNSIKCPDSATAQEMISYIETVKKDGDTVGGIIRCHIDHAPAGLGEPVFDKLHAKLAKAMMSINAAHGFEYGSGFEGACTLGSQNNDAITKNFGTKTNNSGGILGGISTGDQIYFNVAFKPVATILKPQQSIDRAGNEITLQNEGRHDPCVLPRAVPIVEAMAALVMIDMLLQQKAIQ